MARLFEEGEGESACPGKDNCTIFQQSAEGQPEEARCPSCPKRLTNLSLSDSGGGETWNESHLLDRVERFRRERDSGREIYSVVTPEEWEVMQLYDDQHDAYQRSFQVRIAAGFEAMMAMAGPKG